MASSNSETSERSTGQVVAGAVGAGANALSMASQWDTMSSAEKIKKGAQIAKQLGYDNPNMQSAAAIASTIAGWNDMNDEQKAVRAAQILEQMSGGEGNIVGTAYAAYNIAKNWSKMDDKQRAIGTATVAQGAASLAGYSIPGVNVALAAYQYYNAAKAGYKDYYTEGTDNQKKGYIGAVGAAAARGWMTSGPYGAVVGGVMTAVGLGFNSITHGATKSGKGGAQKGRDWVRGDLKRKGLADDNYNITLADGTKVNIGVDGGGGKHKARDVDQLVTGEDGYRQEELGAYDTDYTNDLDYTSSMAGVTFQRLIYGGRHDTIDQMGSQLGNAFLSSVGYGQDMTEENFNKVMANAKALYARAGLTSKEDCLNLIKTAAEAKRLSAADQAAALQTVNMMYDEDGYKYGQQLMQGRQVGITKAKNLPARDPTIQGPPVAEDQAPEGTDKMPDQAAKPAKGMTPIESSTKEIDSNDTPRATSIDKAALGIPEDEELINPVGTAPEGTSFKDVVGKAQGATSSGRMLKSKEEIRQENLNKYSNQAAA